MRTDSDRSVAELLRPSIAGPPSIVPKISRIVSERLGRGRPWPAWIDELTNRVETPVFEPEGSQTLGKGFLLTTTVIMPLAIVGIGLVRFLLFGS